MLRRSILTLLMLSLVAMLVLLTYFWTRSYPPTPLVSLIVTGGRRPTVAPNAYAGEIRKALGEAKRTLEYLPWNVSTGLSEVKPSGPQRRAVILYFNAHGLVDESGDAYLLLDESNPTAAESRLPLGPLLEEVKTFALKSRRRRVALFFDVCKQLDYWQHGIAENPFCARLAEAVAELDLAEANVVVVNSTSPGELSWAAPEFGSTAFSHFLIDGLRGAADDPPTGDGNGEVNTGELASYLERHVADFVRENRGATQTPMRIAFKDFPLTYARRDPTTNSDALASLPRVEQLRLYEAEGYWHRHGELCRRARTEFVAWRTDPVGWAEMERLLLRLEQVHVAGEAYAPEMEPLRNRIEALLAQFEQPEARTQLPAFSLAIAARRGFVTPEVVADLQTQWIDQRTAAAADVGNAKQPDGEATDVEAIKHSYYDVAFAAWHWLLDQRDGSGRVSRDDIEYALRQIDLAVDSPEVDVVEIHFLRILQEYADWDTLAQGCRATSYWLRLRRRRGDGR